MSSVIWFVEVYFPGSLRVTTAVTPGGLGICESFVNFNVMITHLIERPETGVRDKEDIGTINAGIGIRSCPLRYPVTKP